ncbi:uncharacterized protein LOC119453476 [Dermacentor silvarum]|uniref:uncharacterized protein LOC119453476 n=1 Tax=Dermacentor silvarum TaxID=543639 RepID=UPI001896B742|nr:uncharacterized protein LOC119453476 [Dermacentor silvarum]
MKGAVVAFLALYVVAVTCSAHVLSQETKKTQEGGLNQNLGNEVELVGKLLLETAEVLAKDNSKQDDEYFLRDLLEKARDALTNAGKKMTEVAKNAVDDVKTAMQKAFERTKQKASEKALEILAKVMGDSMASYAAEDSGSQSAFRQTVVDKLQLVGNKFVAAGKKLSGH